MTLKNTYKIDKIDNGIVYYTRYTGTLSLKILLESSYERTADPDYTNAVFVVNDFINVDMSRITPDEARVMSARVREVLQKRPHMVVIMIVGDKLAYGLGRIWRGNTLPASASKDLHVVYSKEEAFQIVNAVRKERGL